MKRFLSLIMLAFGLTLNASAGTFPTPADPVPWGWSCSEFVTMPTAQGTLVAFCLSGVGKWQLVGTTPDFVPVLLAQGPITPAAKEVVLLIPPGDCCWFHLQVQSPNGWRTVYPWIH